VQHQLKSSGCKAFSAAIKKYGWENFTHEMLVEYITEDEANVLEVFYIKEHHSFHPHGYNLTEGGGNASPSEETRAKLSAANKGKVSPHKGIPKSEEHKAKLSAVKKGKKHTEETKTKLSTINKGKKLSAETIAKRSATVMGAKRSEETKAKMSAAGKGKIISEETKDKMSAAKKGKPLSKETTAKRIAAHRTLSNETKAKMRSSRLKISYDDALQYFIDKESS
jgi:hypothetical protein